MNNLIDKLKKEINIVKSELSMSHNNDGWWNDFMEKKLITLQNKLKELENDNNRIFNKET